MFILFTSKGLRLWVMKAFHYFGNFKSVSTEVSAMGSVTFGNSGTKMYVSDQLDDDIHQYTLSTAWDITTASYDSKTLDITSETDKLRNFTLKTDGTSLYAVGGTTDNAVFQYTLSSAWDLSTGSYASKTFDLSSECGDAGGIAFKSDGLKMYVQDSDGAIYQYTLSSAWDVSTATYDSVTYTTTEVTSPNDITFRSDGSMFFVIGNSDIVYKYNLSSAWDLSTSSYSNESKSCGTETSSSVGVFFKTDGSKFYISEDTNDRVYEYSI